MINLSIFRARVKALRNKEIAAEVTRVNEYVKGLSCRVAEAFEDQYDRIRKGYNGYITIDADEVPDIRNTLGYSHKSDYIAYRVSQATGLNVALHIEEKGHCKFVYNVSFNNAP